MGRRLVLVAALAGFVALGALGSKQPEQPKAVRLISQPVKPLDATVLTPLPPHYYSITSSAATSRFCGMTIPSDCAVFMLMASSKRSDCNTGRSAGFSPLTIRPV